MGRSVLILILVMAAALQLSSCSAARHDLLGMKIGMPRSLAESVLKEMGTLSATKPDRQEIWTLDRHRTFGTVKLGYDVNDRLRYVTAIVDKAKATERVPFTSVGDVSKAKAYVAEGRHQYVWMVEPWDGSDSFFVNVYGDDAEYLTWYTLIRREGEDEEAETAERE